MSYIVNGIEAKQVGVLLEPSTYDADITPENMQNGMTAYAKGKKVVGTGKAFEEAGYGKRTIAAIRDTYGNEKYGISIFTEIKPNLLFIASTTEGDVVLQTNHILDLAENETISIGVNHSASGDLKVSYDGTHLKFYFENTDNKKTKLIYFFGKDNHI